MGARGPWSVQGGGTVREERDEISDAGSTIDLSGLVVSSLTFPPKPFAVKHLRAWELKSNGEEREDSEDFLEQLRDCLENANMRVGNFSRTPMHFFETGRALVPHGQHVVKTWQ